MCSAPGKARKKAQSTLRLEFNDELWERLYGFKSGPIEKRPGRRICVRVISQFGEESSKVLEMVGH